MPENNFSNGVQALSTVSRDDCVVVDNIFKQNTLILKEKYEDFEVEFEFIPANTKNGYSELAEIDLALDDLSKKVSVLDAEIDKLTNHADALDYSIAVASGILTGLIDSFYVGEINWDLAKADAHKTINKFIEKKAKSAGYKGKNGLKGAIQYLEDHYKIPSDNLWSGREFSSTKSHHLDDFAHHPTLLGLVANVITTLFRVGIFVNRDGEWHFALAETDFKELAKIWAPIIISAVLNWLVTIAEKKYSEEQEREIPKPIRVLLRALASAQAALIILKVTNNWIGHLISDMGGSKNTPDGGMGIPGIFLSLLKEISSIPGINMSGLPELLDEWYKKDHFNMRTEMAVFNIDQKQAVPVIINELLVRGFYFVRNIIAEAKLHDKNWKEYNWEKTVPFSNRTVVRMLTIAHGTFVAVDLGDAAIRTAISGEYVEVYSFLARMAFRVNFVGIGRFTIAVFSDVKMGYQRSKKVYERMDLNSKMLNWYGAKVFYKQAGVWINAKNAEIAMKEMEETAAHSINTFANMLVEINSDIGEIKILADKAELHNPGIKKQLLKLLK